MYLLQTAYNQRIKISYTNGIESLLEEINECSNAHIISRSIRLTDKMIRAR